MTEPSTQLPYECPSDVSSVDPPVDMPPADNNGDQNGLVLMSLTAEVENERRKTKNALKRLETQSNANACN